MSIGLSTPKHDVEILELSIQRHGDIEDLRLTRFDCTLRLPKSNSVMFGQSIATIAEPSERLSMTGKNLNIAQLTDAL